MASVENHLSIEDLAARYRACEDMCALNTFVAKIAAGYPSHGHHPLFHEKKPHPGDEVRLEKEQRPERSAGLVPRGLLHRLHLLLHRLESRVEHGSSQLGNLLAITDSGFDSIHDQPLL